MIEIKKPSRIERAKKRKKEYWQFMVLIIVSYIISLFPQYIIDIILNRVLAYPFRKFRVFIKHYIFKDI